MRVHLPCSALAMLGCSSNGVPHLKWMLFDGRAAHLSHYLWWRGGQAVSLHHTHYAEPLGCRGTAQTSRAIMSALCLQILAEWAVALLQQAGLCCYFLSLDAALQQAGQLNRHLQQNHISNQPLRCYLPCHTLTSACDLHPFAIVLEDCRQHRVSEGSNSTGLFPHFLLPQWVIYCLIFTPSEAGGDRDIKSTVNLCSYVQAFP